MTAIEPATFQRQRSSFARRPKWLHVHFAVLASAAVTLGLGLWLGGHKGTSNWPRIKVTPSRVQAPSPAPPILSVNLAARPLSVEEERVLRTAPRGNS